METPQIILSVFATREHFFFKPNLNFLCCNISLLHLVISLRWVWLSHPHILPAGLYRKQLDLYISFLPFKRARNSFLNLFFHFLSSSTLERLLDLPCYVHVLLLYWTQYSRCAQQSLNSAQFRVRMASLDLLAVLLLIQHCTWLIVLAKRAHCWVFFTSRTFVEGCMFSNCSPARCIGLICLGHRHYGCLCWSLCYIWPTSVVCLLSSSPAFQCVDALTSFPKACSTLSSMSHIKHY